MEKHIHQIRTSVSHFPPSFAFPSRLRSSPPPSFSASNRFFETTLPPPSSYLQLDTHARITTEEGAPPSLPPSLTSAATRSPPPPLCCLNPPSSGSLVEYHTELTCALSAGEGEGTDGGRRKQQQHQQHEGGGGEHTCLPLPCGVRRGGEHAEPTPRRTREEISTTTIHCRLRRRSQGDIE